MQPGYFPAGVRVAGRRARGAPWSEPPGARLSYHLMRASRVGPVPFSVVEAINPPASCGDPRPAPLRLPHPRFRATFPAFVRTKRHTGVYLRADGRVPYAEVVQVLAAIRAAGVNDVGLVAEPEVVER